MTQTKATPSNRESALLETSRGGAAFGKHTEQRERWLATPIITNRVLGKSGMPFTIVEAAEKDMPATAIDIGRGVEPGTMIKKAGYLCRAQADTVIDEEKTPTVVPKGDLFLILFTANSIRSDDLSKIQALLREDGELTNICVQLYKTKFQPAAGLVSADQWRVLE